jgi:hypothetical protein
MPGIHVFLPMFLPMGVDSRDEPGHEDDAFPVLSALSRLSKSRENNHHGKKVGRNRVSGFGGRA